MVAGRYPARPLSRRPWLLALAAASLLAALAGADKSAHPQAHPDSKSSSPDPTAPVAVVELFTSEFCGACPGADQLLSEIGAEARRSGQRILPLAFHVDYFDRGANVDPFGSPAFSKRQRSYAAALGSNDLYTPQMLVNGRNPFVGSERNAAVQHIRAALKKPATAAVRLTLEDLPGSPASVRVNCDVQGATTSASLQVALVERKPSALSRTGRAASPHDNVVRILRTLPLNRGTYQTVDFPLPRGVNRQNASIVGFVQDTRTMAIRGGSSIDLGSPDAERVASAGR